VYLDGILAQKNIAQISCCCTEEQMADETPPSLRMPRSEREQGIANRALFIQCMADPVRRRIAFDVVERNCRDTFGEGEEGLDLFVKLVADVRRAKVDEAVSEFEGRFAPMLDQALLKKKLQR
jgi:hypothetical protein